MPRSRRANISRDFGIIHVYSRVAAKERILGDREKDYFLKLVERFSAGFFVSIHAFAVMSNHFHLLLSEGAQDARQATKQELLARYQRIFGNEANPPVGHQNADGSFIPDDDGGIERLRRRLASVSCFVQELKQCFSHWYNLRHNRSGYLWGSRFGCQLVQRGDAAWICSAYIDLNPVRAGMVKIPESYPWCSLGLKAQYPDRAQALLHSPFGVNHHTPPDDRAYRLFVYRYGRLNGAGNRISDPLVVAEIDDLCRRIGMIDLLKCRLRNLSIGLAMGSEEFVSCIQRSVGRNRMPKQILLGGTGLFGTRSLSPP